MVNKREEEFSREINLLRKRVAELEGVDAKLQKEDAALSSSEAQFRRLFETAKDGILILDAETGVVDDANPFLLDLLGYSLEELRGKAVWELGFLKDTFANREKFLELQSREYVRYDDLPLETSGGQSRSVEFVSNVYLVGRKKVIQCNIRDITARKKAEKDLRESEETFLNVFQKSPATIILSMPYEGILLDVNETFLKYMGYTRDEVIGLSSAELGLFADINDRQQLINILKDKGAVFAYECRFRAKNGKILTGLISIGFIKFKGKTCQLSTVIDITERKRAEVELIRAQKLDSLGVLAGGIAHDFNNIITGVIGNISLALGDMRTDDKNYEILADAEKAAFRTKNLTQQLLTFSKGGAPQKKPMELHYLLKDAAVFAARGSRTKCKFIMARDLMPADIDPGQIGQVISNMVINSEQAMPSGGEIVISAQNTSLPEKNAGALKAGPYIIITIRDNGIGIPEIYLKNIFDPYFTTKQTGSGLGLASSYSIIKNHGGYIGVESRVGKGTSFSIYLPAFQGRYVPESIERGPDMKKGLGRILILDDEEIVRVVGTRILTKLGYTAEAFNESKGAVTRYCQTWGNADAFDAVVLDLTIPGGRGGQGVLAELKRINPKVKAVVSSGYSADPIMANYADYGFSGSLPKPFDLKQASEVFYSLLMKNKVPAV